MLTIIVALAIVAAFLFERWLDWRQVRHVAAHRGEVPAAFAGRISLEDHQKAADYTIAKQRLGLKQDIAGAVLSLVLLVGGGFGCCTPRSSPWSAAAPWARSRWPAPWR